LKVGETRPKGSMLVGQTLVSGKFACLLRLHGLCTAYILQRNMAGENWLEDDMQRMEKNVTYDCQMDVWCHRCEPQLLK